MHEYIITKIWKVKANNWVEGLNAAKDTDNDYMRIFDMPQKGASIQVQQEAIDAYVEAQREAIIELLQRRPKLVEGKSVFGGIDAEAGTYNIAICANCNRLGVIKDETVRAVTDWNGSNLLEALNKGAKCCSEPSYYFPSVISYNVEE